MDFLLPGKIRIFHTDDGSLKQLGELLSNETSRSIIRALGEKAHYTNELSKKSGMSVSLVIHHLKKLENLGLVEVSNKKINGVDRRFFRLNKDIFISKDTKEKTAKKERLKNIFKDGVKITGVLSAGVFSFVLIRELLKNMRVPDNMPGADQTVSSIVTAVEGPLFSVFKEDLASFIVGLSVSMAAFVLIRIKKRE